MLAVWMRGRDHVVRKVRRSGRTTPGEIEASTAVDEERQE